jgi:hypothetical protein
MPQRLQDRSTWSPSSALLPDIVTNWKSHPGNGTAGNVMLQHLEGGPWLFLTVARYSSWEDFAKAEKADVAETLKPDGGWLGVRNHSTYHNDTITDRIAP